MSRGAILAPFLDVAIEVRFWTDSRRSDFVATTSAVRIAIVAALKQAGIGLPDPDVRILVPRHVDKWQTALGVGNSNKSHNSES